MTVFQAILIAIVEGITEFLPVSSTGHMALVSALMNIEENAFTKLFIENIQFGAILSVLVIYWRKFLDFKSFNFYIKLLIAFIPAAVVGLSLKHYIDDILESPVFISAILFLGGIILIFVDKWFRNPEVSREEEITYKKSFIIGLFQILSVIFPGLSRSAATIIGGMHQKLTRQVAAEFSFFLAVPTLAGAFVISLYDAWKNNPGVLTCPNINLLVLGNVIAFIVAIIAIKAFIAFLSRHGFRLFGYYRIVAGIFLLIFFLFVK
ncbi:MAG: undecaprenyl-diphosphate phosphatase [Syntrophothermus sp.]